MKLSKKGMSLVEIIVSIALISIVLVFLMGLFINVRKTYLTSRTDSKYEMNVAKVVKAIGDDIENYGLYCMKQIETESSDTSYVLVYNQNRSSNPFDRIKKVLELKENADTKDLYTGEAKKINYISYGYDDRYINNFTAQERVSKVTTEIPDTAIIGKSLGYENSIIVSTKETSENKKLVEIKIPIENDVRTDYSINLTGIAAKDDFECAPEELTPIKSYTLTFDSKGGKPQESTKLIAKGFAYGTLPKPVYSGHKFLGWFTSETGGTQVTEDILVDSEGDKTLYAHWEVNSSGGGTTEGGTFTVDEVLSELKITPESGTPNFASTATTDEGVYAMEDDYGTSYYYRGAVTNNYVKFAGFYWRIVRINGDGSLRVEYDGTQAWDNGVSNINRVVSLPNLTFTNADRLKSTAYAGFMYNNLTANKEETQQNYYDSLLKFSLDKWYETNIKSEINEKYISDTLFCNDRSTADAASTWKTDDSAKGFGTNITAYGAYSRILNANNTWNKTNPSPKLKCPQKNDRFTVDDKDIGNGNLNYPIGALTVDELSLAGLLGGTANSSNYLYKGRSYHTMTPAVYTSSGINIFYCYSTGYINYGLGNANSAGVVPVINLSTEFVKDMIGEGTKEEPYRLDDPNESKSLATLERMREISGTTLPSKGRLYNFATVATTNLGIYETNDNYGVSYYFRGAVTNNYVKFAGFYWRIVRINGDGTLRVMYDGAQAYANGTANTGRLVTISSRTNYNDSLNDVKYVGYMWGPSGATKSDSKSAAQENLNDSNLKWNLDEWYVKNLSSYSSYISDTMFCNDRSLAPQANYWWTSSDSALGYGENKTTYGAWHRVWTTSGSANTTNPMPSFMCPQKNDSFTMNDTKTGNGSLFYSIGTITVDEAMAAGALAGTSNTKFYMYKGYTFYTMTPSSLNNAGASVFRLNGSVTNSSGALASPTVSTTDIYMVPVINLSTEFVNNMTGKGTTTLPYQLP